MGALSLKILLKKAFAIGCVAGVVMCIAQIYLLNPIIFEAEAYELSSLHQHSDEGELSEWAPADGYERLYLTLIASILAGLGFSSMLLALLSHFQLNVEHRNKSSVLRHGILWGVAGYIVFFVAPSVGLPPEIPGVERTPVENRQLWWFFCVLCVALSFLVISFSHSKYRLVAALLVLVPYLVGAPELSGGQVLHPDPAVVLVQKTLQSKFVFFSAIANFAFWLCIGLSSVWAFNKYSAEYRASAVLK